MNLKETIRKTLKEETEKDLSLLMTNLLNDAIVSSNDDVCKIEVTAPWNREELDGQKRYKFYKVLIYFISGIGTISWEEYYKTKDKKDEVMNRAWDLIHTWFNEPVDIYSKNVNECQDNNLQETIRKVLKETTSLPSFIKRRIKLSEEDIINIVRKESMIAYRTDNITPKQAASIGCRHAAFEILDTISEDLSDMGDDEYNKLENELSDFLKSKYKEQMTNFLDGFLDPSGDELGHRYTFWKHADRYGGNGFAESYETWNKLLRAHSSRFPDLDWAEVKSKLDNKMIDGQPLLIKSPGDKNNKYGYYFSVIKRKLK